MILGSAYLVTKINSSSNEHYVVKEVNIGNMNAYHRKSALKEVKALGSVNHQGIVKLIDSFVVRGILYIVMEYADGGDLQQKLNSKMRNNRRNRCFNEKEVMILFVQICCALLHIHSKNILHRDLKPANIFLTKSGLVKVVRVTYLYLYDH